MDNSDEFAVIVRRHQSMVFGIACNFLRNPALAEELAQEVFLELHRIRGSLQSPEHVQNWLRQVTTHRCIDASRRRRVRPQLALADAPEPAVEVRHPDPFLTERIRTMTASLPERARALVVLRYQEDMEPTQIAELLGIPVNTVKSQLHRAVALLRSKLERARVRT